MLKTALADDSEERCFLAYLVPAREGVASKYEERESERVIPLKTSSGKNTLKRSLKIKVSCELFVFFRQRARVGKQCGQQRKKTGYHFAGSWERERKEGKNSVFVKFIFHQKKGTQILRQTPGFKIHRARPFFPFPLSWPGFELPSRRQKRIE